MMVGPTVPGNLQVGSTSNPVGDVTDGVVTMADVLGIKSEVVNSGYLHANARSLFDRI